MFEIIALAATGAATVAGFIQSRRFVRGRLQFVEKVQGMHVPMLAGVTAAVVAAPVTWILPLVGAGTAVLFGAGVGAGVAAGARDIRRRRLGSGS